jgi:predicted nucleotidyltransferase
MDQSEVVRKLVLYKQLVSLHFNVERLFLFGSYAHGDQKTDSDIDVAIVVNNVDGDFFSYAPLLWKLRREIDDRIEPVLFDRNRDSSGFLQEIINTGIEI